MIQPPDNTNSIYFKCNCGSFNSPIPVTTPKPIHILVEKGINMEGDILDSDEERYRSSQNIDEDSRKDRPGQ